MTDAWTSDHPAGAMRPAESAEGSFCGMIPATIPPRIVAAAPTPVLPLRTRRVELRPILPADLPLLHGWRNEETFMRLVTGRRNLVDFDQFVAERRRALENDYHVQLLIVRRRDGRPVGLVYSRGLSRENHFVFLNLYVIPEFVRQGYGAHAAALMIRYLFSFYDLNKICVEAMAFNDHSKAIPERAGFVQEGVLRKEQYDRGVFHDVLRFGLLRAEAKTASDFVEREVRLENRASAIQRSAKT